MAPPDRVSVGRGWRAVRWGAVVVGVFLAGSIARGEGVGASVSDDGVARRLTGLDGVAAALDARERSIQRRELSVAAREADLRAAEAQIAVRLTELEDVRTQIAALLDQRDAEAQQKIDELAATVGGMKPKAAAPVLSSVREDLAVEVLATMPASKSGKILGAMDPLVAARLAEKLGTVQAAAPAAPAGTPAPKAATPAKTTPKPVTPAATPAPAAPERPTTAAAPTARTPEAGS